MNIKLATIILLFFSIFFSFSCKTETDSRLAGKQISEQTVQTELRWLGQWYGEGRKEDLVREMSREFAFLNQGINVELTFPYEMAGLDSFADPFSSVADSILSWVEADSWPFDILVCDRWFYQEIATFLNDPYWGNKHLVDFQHEDWFIEAHKEYVLDSEEYIGGFGGIAPGAFIEGAWDLLFVSSAVEDILNIEVKDYDMTVDDFLLYARRVHEHNQTNENKITFCASNYQTIERVLNHMVMSEMAGLEDASYAQQIQALARVYQKLEELAAYKPTEQYHEYATDRELKHDQTLFHIHATWVTIFWQRQNPEGELLMRPCEYPSMNDKAAYAYSGTYNAVFAIPQKAKNKDEAIRLMQYISSEDIAEKWENYSKCPTGLNSRISFNEFGTDAFSNFSTHISEKYDNRLSDISLPQELFGGRQTHINFHVMDIAEGRMTAANAINAIRSQIR